jgi:hypothetical protein
MKNKKLFLPTVIILISILVTAIFSVIISIAQKPTVTEAEFPFKITYELDGETVVIEDVYKVRYDGNAGYADTKTRTYVGTIGGEENTVYTLKKGENTRIELWTQFYPDYMMGDSYYDYFDDEEFKPMIYYYDSEEIEYYDEETLAAQGVKLVSFEYPTPIENEFVFSHISYLSGFVVLPALVFALLAFIAILIFVKKENGLKYNWVDVVSIVSNSLTGSIYLSFVTLIALLIDMEGGGPELYYQIIYFVPAFSLLCIAASVALRRKGYRVTSLIAGLIGPAVFALYLIVFYTASNLML